MTERGRARRNAASVVAVSVLLSAATAEIARAGCATASAENGAITQTIIMCAVFGVCEVGFFSGSRSVFAAIFGVKVFCVYFLTKAATLNALTLSFVFFSFGFEAFAFLSIAEATAATAFALAVAVSSSGTSAAWGIPPQAMAPTTLACATLASAAGVIAGRALAAANEAAGRREKEIARLEETVANLAKTNTAFQTYATYIEETSREEERLRISREIHDIVGYSMTNLLMIVQAALYSKDGEQVTGLLQKAQIHINESLEEIRFSLRKLRSTQKKTLHGTDLLRYLAENFSKVSGIDITLDFVSFPGTLDSRIEEILYRMIQETMTNSFRHGKATKIAMSFWTRGNGLVVQIRDNGKKRAATMTGGGIGLEGMRERVESAGGALHTEATADGFTVSAEIPISSPQGKGNVS